MKNGSVLSEKVNVLKEVKEKRGVDK